MRSAGLTQRCPGDASLRSQVGARFASGGGVGRFTLAAPHGGPVHCGPVHRGPVHRAPAHRAPAHGARAHVVRFHSPGLTRRSGAPPAPLPPHLCPRPPRWVSPPPCARRPPRLAGLAPAPPGPASVRLRWAPPHLARFAFSAASPPLGGLAPPCDRATVVGHSLGAATPRPFCPRGHRTLHRPPPISPCSTTSPLPSAISWCSPTSPGRLSGPRSSCLVLARPAWPLARPASAGVARLACPLRRTRPLRRAFFAPAGRGPAPSRWFSGWSSLGLLGDPSFLFSLLHIRALLLPRFARFG